MPCKLPSFRSHSTLVSRMRWWAKEFVKRNGKPFRKKMKKIPVWVGVYVVWRKMECLEMLAAQPLKQKSEWLPFWHTSSRLSEFDSVATFSDICSSPVGGIT